MESDFLEWTDEQLVREFQEQNTPEAFEMLVKRYKDPLINYVYRFVGSRDLAADIVQDTMIKFYLNKDSYKSLAKFSTWIYTIAGNLARNELKRRRRRVIFSIDSENEDKVFEIRDNTTELPDVLTDNRMKYEFIQQKLLKVKPIYREVVILRDIQGLSYEEIAEITGLSIGTVKSRINRGRTHLQKLLKQIYDGL